MTYIQKLISLLEEHMSRGFYVGDSIPKHKLENAIQYFPIESEVIIYGLIDNTIFGSNKLGLAITSYGLIWKNSWTIPSTKYRLSWKELLSRKNKIALEQHSIGFGNDIRFDMTSNQMEKRDALNLMLSLVNLLTDIGDDLINIYKKETINSKTTAINSNINKITSNTKMIESDHQTYETSLILSLALMTMADGQIENNEIEMVSLFIEEEELINDKDKALSLYGEYIEKLESSHGKSNAMYKLQCAKMITSIRKLQDKDDIERLKIMLEGMVEVSGKNSNASTIEMMERITANL